MSSVILAKLSLSVRVPVHPRLLEYLKVDWLCPLGVQGRGWKSIGIDGEWLWRVR